ncbi:MAG: hypothetical protein ACRDV8_00730, partial [Acidimicrobiales bacterium]
RALFDSLQLDVIYQPADSALDVAATLYDLGSETAQSAARESAEDWLAPPAGLEPATHGLGTQYRPSTATFSVYLMASGLGVRLSSRLP